MERSTDTDIEKCRKRYGIFKAHYAATLRLQQHFPFTLIDAMGTLAETQEQITKELRWAGLTGAGFGVLRFSDAAAAAALPLHAHRCHGHAGRDAGADHQRAEVGRVEEYRWS